MIDRNALLLIGGPGNRVLEEPPATIDAQLKALVKGTISAVMLPIGSVYRPEVPLIMDSIEIPSGPGAGTWIFNPAVLTGAAIRQISEDGDHHYLLGHIQSKIELQYLEAVGCSVEVVQAVDVDGIVIQDSVIEKGNEGVRRCQISILQFRHPDAHIQVISEEELVDQRQEKAVRHG
jgi:hypothetical protein